MTAPPEPPPQIPYAMGPQRLGVTYENSADDMRIIIPPPQWVRQAGVAIFIAILISLPLYAIAEFVTNKDLLNFRFVGFVIEYALLLFIFAIAHAHLVFWTEIRLTRGALKLSRFHQFGPRRQYLFAYSVSRKKMYDVHHVSHSRNLAIYAHGEQMLEFRVSNNAEISRWVAEAIREAAGLTITRTSN